MNYDNVLKIFNLKKKSELCNYCKTAQIRRSEFFAFISDCKSGAYEYNYACHSTYKVPEPLRLNDSDTEALASNSIGLAKGKAKTTINKIFQTFEDSLKVLFSSWRLLQACFAFKRPVRGRVVR
tara:strand:+ start:66 stop:437 length:372 start_codon:yes stop_codon:yes gene_type:complete